MRCFLSTISITAIVVGFCAVSSAEFNINLKSLTSKKTMSLFEGYRELGTVLIFLSVRCQSTKDHIEFIKSVAKKYPQFRFIGIHSNADENESEATEHFMKLNLPFEVLGDEKGKIADHYKVFKTPHALIFNSENHLVYEGGLTDSHNFKRAKEIYLQAALEDLSQNRKLQASETRTVGCVILREKDLK